MPARLQIAYNLFLLLFWILILSGLITSCAPALVGPIEPNSALVMGRVVINNKSSKRLLPWGTVDQGIVVEVVSRDESQLFKATTEEEGYFFIPNIPPSTYIVRRLVVERRLGDRSETYTREMKQLAFTPVPGKTGYIGSLIIDISQAEVATTREVREDERAKTYFLQRHGGSPWASREFMAAGPRPVPSMQVSPEKAAEKVEAKPVTRTDIRAEKPEWKVGYEWRYAWKQPGTSGSLTREIIREDTFEGVPCYVIRTAENESFFPKDTLGLLATMSGGKLTFKRDAPFQPVSWPLEVGKVWRNTFTLERLQQKSSQTYDTRFVVSKIEEVTVPAGTFEAFKIENYNFYAGHLEAEYWYSPKVKMFIKERLYQEKGVLERELISFKVD